MTFKTTNAMPTRTGELYTPTTDEVIVCPICEYPHVALSSIEVTGPGRKKGRITVSREGIVLDPDVEVTYRGSEVKIRYTGECGHEWTHNMIFHKGHTSFRMDARNCPITEVGPIWRD